MRGDSYMAIMERGGGIVSTNRATRKAKEEELVDTGATADAMLGWASPP